MARRKKTSSRRSKGMGKLGNTLLSVGAGALYGAFRNQIAAKVPQVSMLGNYSDNAILGGSALALKLITGNKWVNAVANPVIVIESALVGSKLMSGVSGTTSSDNSVIYY